MSVARNLDQYYEILELPSTASHSDVQKAYIKAKKTYSADNPALYSLFSKDEARELLRLVEEAYCALTGGIRNEVPELKSVKPAQISSYREEIIETNSEYVIKKREPIYNLPDGTGRTLLGTYPLDAAFEAEIAACAQFDGEFLKKVRTYKCVSIEALADWMRVSKSHLNAIEGFDMKSLPAAVFVRGFLVQISRALGLNEKKVTESYLTELKKRSGAKA